MAAHYKTGTSDYTCFREVVNTESMLKLYELTGDKELLALAVQAYEGFNRQYAENDSSFDFLMSDQKPIFIFTKSGSGSQEFDSYG